MKYKASKLKNETDFSLGIAFGFFDVCCIDFWQKCTTLRVQARFIFPDPLSAILLIMPLAFGVNACLVVAGVAGVLLVGI